MMRQALPIGPELSSVDLVSANARAGELFPISTGMNSWLPRNDPSFDDEDCLFGQSSELVIRGSVVGKLSTRILRHDGFLGYCV